MNGTRRTAKAALLTAGVVAMGLMSPLPSNAATPVPVLPHTTGGISSHAMTPKTTTSSGGVSVTTPSSVTVYNKSKATVTATVKVSSGTHKAVVTKSIAAYVGSRKTTSGTSVRLGIGTYSLATTVRYRSYKLVTKFKTVTTKTWHPVGDSYENTCTITAVSSSVVEDPAGDPAIDDIIDTANCISADFPGQTVTVPGTDLYDIPQGDGMTTFVVGSQITTQAPITYPGYYTTSTKQVSYQVKTWIAYANYTTKKSKFVVHDGGYQRIYVHSESANTGYFTVPKHWLAAYSFSCAAFGYSGNWILNLHQHGTPSYDDQFLKNIIANSGTEGWNFTGAGTFRFEVITECDWAIVVRWK